MASSQPWSKPDTTTTVTEPFNVKLDSSMRRKYFHMQLNGRRKEKRHQKCYARSIAAKGWLLPFVPSKYRPRGQAGNDNWDAFHAMIVGFCLSFCLSCESYTLANLIASRGGPSLSAYWGCMGTFCRSGHWTAPYPQFWDRRTEKTLPPIRLRRHDKMVPWRHGTRRRVLIFIGINSI